MVAGVFAAVWLGRRGCSFHERHETGRPASPASKTLNGYHLRRGKFVAVGDKGTIVTSTTRHQLGRHSTDTNLYLRKIVYGNSRFVALGYTLSPAFNYSLVSTDGNTWTSYYVASNNRRDC